ncbi:hypothetical protein [Clostridium drakei]|uniref:hypothetical protein n=1 Tax=Clostridium drakei TaxID=332101 RepID=UPI000A838D26|nr:hypothetical protein [Clostridium drakei]
MEMIDIYDELGQKCGKIKLALSIQAHHALVDGIHGGQFFSDFQEILSKPSKYL